jgi:hypothetical protein
VAQFVQPFVALASVIAGPLMVKLDIADGVRHAQLLDDRGESVRGKLSGVPAFVSCRSPISTLPPRQARSDR